MGFFLGAWEILALAAAISVDAFAASFAYGGKRIKIPLLSVIIISVVCSLVLGIALFAGSVIRDFIPANATAIISFAILFILGFFKLFDTKTELKNHDKDNSKIISVTEAVALAVALSLDGFAVGFGAALANVNIFAAVLSTFVIGALAVIGGCYLGNKIAGKINVSWVSGILLIILAFNSLL